MHQGDLSNQKSYFKSDKNILLDADNWMIYKATTELGFKRKIPSYF